jgi:phenylacetate-CoA ligase
MRERQVNLSIISLIDKIPFGQPAERGFFLYSKIPPDFLKKIEENNFRKTITYVYQHSKFYKRKFDERAIHPEKVKGPGDLGDFFTTAEDIRENVNDFVCKVPDTAFETTGTTSKRSKRVYFSRDEIREAGWSGAVGLWALGVRREDRIASSFDYSFWVSGPVLQASCEVLGCFHVEAGRIDPEEFYERLKDYGITVIVGDPSWVVGLAEVAQKRGAWPVKLIIGGGENLTEEARRFVESVWKTDLILSYGQTEAFGAIGIESRNKEGYHLNEFHNYFEIINPNREGVGELVYTTLNRRVMPLVRYRSGDLTRFILTLSTSGLPGRRIEKLKGRVDEWTATAMGNLAPWIFEPIFSNIRGIGPDWQIEIHKDQNKDRILFHLEAQNGSLDVSRLREEVFSNIQKNLKDAWRCYEAGLFFMDLEMHPKGTLRTGRKLVRLVDRRKF